MFMQVNPVTPRPEGLGLFRVDPEDLLLVVCLFYGEEDLFVGIKR
jgi:hypothetical protein